MNQIEDIFRNPNILIQSIKDMQQKQEESLKEIQSKLTEMNFFEGEKSFKEIGSEFFLVEADEALKRVVASKCGFERLPLLVF